MQNTIKLSRVTNGFVIVAVVLLILYFARPFLVPFAWALMIALGSIRFVEHLEFKTKLPRSLIIFLFILVVMGMIVVLLYFFFYEITRIARDLPDIGVKLSAALHGISTELRNIGIGLPENIDQDFIKQKVSGQEAQLLKFISAVGANLWNVILVLIYVYFLLYYRELITKLLEFRVEAHDTERKLRSREFYQRILEPARSYIFGLFIMTVISAVMNYAVLLIFGLKFALFFGAFIAILNLIPYIGNLIAIIVVALFTLLTKDSILSLLWIMIGLFVVNFLQDYVIRPLLMGNKLRLNAFVVFIVVIIGGFIWGVSGMILFIPIIGVIKIVLEQNERLAPYAVFMDDVKREAVREIQ